MKREIVNKLIKEFQEQNSKKSQEILFNEYYRNGCKWANKFMQGNTYTNLISYEIGEVNSFVFLSFWKALKTYKFDSANTLSFKNYFFQMIKYQAYAEIRKNFNWRTIPNYAEQCQAYLKERKENIANQSNSLEDMDISRKCEIIMEYLSTKNIIYAKIFKLKSIGYKNKEICQKLGLTNMEVKSKCQYIKKLILNQFATIDNVV